MVRCKFRCMEVTRSWKQVTIAKFRPVSPKGSSYPEGCVENQAFWDATPAGEAELHLKEGSVFGQQLEPGQTYYFDMNDQAEADQSVGPPALEEWIRDWKLWKVSHLEHQIDAHIDLSWNNERDVVRARSTRRRSRTGTRTPTTSSSSSTRTSTPCRRCSRTTA